MMKDDETLSCDEQGLVLFCQGQSVRASQCQCHIADRERELTQNSAGCARNTTDRLGAAETQTNC